MINISPEEQDFLADLKYKTTEEGGRKMPALTRYRPHIKFPFSDYLTSGQQTFIDKDRVFPGESVLAYIKIIAVDVFKFSLTEGTEFEFCEGPGVMGSGKIIKVINPVLKKS